MSGTIIVNEPEGEPFGSEGEVVAAETVAEEETAQVEAQADAAVEIASIEADKEIAIAAIHAEARVAEAEAYADAQNEDREEWQQSIEAIRAEMLAHRTEMQEMVENILRASILPASEAMVESLPNPSESGEVVLPVEVPMEEVPEPSPPKRRKGLHWI